MYSNINPDKLPKSQTEIKHCYSRGAEILRKDLIKENSD